MTRSARCQQMLLAHQAQHALAPDPDVLGAQPEVYLTMPLAVEGAGRQDGANLNDQLVVRKRRLRAAVPAVRGRRRDPGGVDARARRVQRLADERHRVALLRPGAYSSPERFNFLNSSPYPFFSRNHSTISSFIVSSPTFACTRLSSRSAPGVSRRLNPLIPPSRKIRRHRSSSCTGTCVSRDTVSSSSPFKSRSTISAFARALHRSGSSSPVRSAASIRLSSSRPSFP